MNITREFYFLPKNSFDTHRPNLSRIDCDSWKLYVQIVLVCRKQILKIGLFLLMNCKMFGNGNDAEKRLGKENRNLSQELICKTYGEKEEKIST